MISNYREKWFNRPLEQWLADTIREARRDAVSLQQIYGALSDDFNISTDGFDEAALYVLNSMFKSGIFPVVSVVGGGWVKDQGFIDVSETEARNIMAAVKNEPELATFAGIWLGIPD